MVTVVQAADPATTSKNVGNAYLAVGAFQAAAAHFEEALRYQPNLLEARHNLGIAHYELGQWDKAIACLQAVLEAQPDCAVAFYNLGNTLKAQGNRPAATGAFEQALRLMPDNHQVAYSLGVLAHEQGDLDRAKVYYRGVLRLNPANADASNNLATLLKEQGAFAEAVAQYRQTLKIRPDHALAFYNLSELAAGGRFDFVEDDLKHIKACLVSGSHGPVEKSLFHFTLATAHDKQGAYDEAFGHYQEANNLRHRLLKDRNVSFDAHQHQALIESVKEIFDRAYFERVQAWGLDTEVPVFIVGMPRSGSTLVEQILASHPRVFGAGEIGEITRFTNKKPSAEQRGVMRAPMPDTAPAAHELAGTYLECLKSLGNGADRVTSKTLDNYYHLGLIATLFPRARIIHCRRDPLDLCLSCYFQNFQDMPFAWSLENIGACYHSYEKLMAHWARVLPMPIHDVTYEELVYDQEGVTRALLTFCGLDWDDRCLTFFKNQRAVRTASNVQVRNAVSTGALGRWKNYRSHLEPLFKALGRPVERMSKIRPSVGNRRGLSSMELLPTLSFVPQDACR